MVLRIEACTPDPVPLRNPATDIAALELKRGGFTLRAGFDRMSAQRLMCGNFEAAAYLGSRIQNPLCLLNRNQAVHIRGCTVSA